MADYGTEPRLPAIPDLHTGSVEAAVRVMKEWIEVRQGARGSELDRAVTMRDLLNSGVATGAQLSPVFRGPAPIPLIPGTDSPAIPPTPTDLSATGTLRHIFLSWEFARGYNRLANFEVWRSETDALGDAVLIAQPYETVYADEIPPESARYYWVRAVSDAGSSPFNAVAGTLGETPFFLQETDTVVNGEPVVPRMYIKAGYIMNGVITNAKIGDLAVDDAKVVSMSVAKLTAGQLGVSSYIESTSYVSGSTGWRINGNGNAEFSNATVRGGVYATYGQVGGNLIDSTGIQSPGYNGVSGWRLNSDGSIFAGSGTFRGSITGATGTFSGSITGATGTFAGNVHGGQFTTGSFTGYAWPPGGGGGSYLGPSGLLIGNALVGKYLQVTADGNIYAPGLSIVDGTLTINQANVINTLNVAGGAISAASSASTVSGITVDYAAWTTVQSVVHTSGGQRVFVFGSASGAATGDYGGGSEGWSESVGLQARLLRDGTLLADSMYSVASFSDVPPAGTYTYHLQIRPENRMSFGNAMARASGQATYRNLMVLETKR